MTVRATELKLRRRTSRKLSHTDRMNQLKMHESQNDSLIRNTKQCTVLLKQVFTMPNALLGSLPKIRIDHDPSSQQSKIVTDMFPLVSARHQL